MFSKDFKEINNDDSLNDLIRFEKCIKKANSDSMQDDLNALMERDTVVEYISNNFKYVLDLTIECKNKDALETILTSKNEKIVNARNEHTLECLAQKFYDKLFENIKVDEIFVNDFVSYISNSMNNSNSNTAELLHNVILDTYSKLYYDKNPADRIFAKPKVG